MKRLLLIIGFLAIAAGATYWFACRSATLGIKNAFSIKNSGLLSYPCGALTSEESLARFGIADNTAVMILKTNNFAKTMWVFSNLPINRIVHVPESGMIFVVPSNTIYGGKLYFAQVRTVPVRSVKLASPD